MDRAEWGRCDDPQAMLAYLTTFAEIGLPRAPKRGQVSDRKLRLFVEAAGCDLCHVSGMSPAEQAEYVAGASCGTPAGKAALLREIVGDPFALVSRTLMYEPPLWPAPDELRQAILSLAQAAYDERGGRECGACAGVGQRHQTKQLSGERAWMVCPDCRGAGRTDDGTLDPVRLLVLADALEEAGCDSEPLLRHLRTDADCPGCGRRWDEPHCPWCGQVLPRPAPHIRGCWALDLILGKS